MNCRQGDIARIVRPYVVDAAIGRFVTVIAVAPNRPVVIDGHIFEWNGASWIVEGNVPDQCGEHVYKRLVIADRCLRPIRGAEGEDEMLRIAGKPNDTVHEFIEAHTERATA